ncbi:MAG TPA: ABC transporter ATP-binding protein [Actinomycetales bacterium]|nr:ABC transporter ATP-binding protein [Actinomycetales bacterium]
MAIEVANLTKRYGSVTAVNDVSFVVPNGSAFAFLGVNGAGKTTTIGCLTTLLQIDEGEARVAGFDTQTQSAQIRDHTGVVFQDSLLDEMLSVRENLVSRGKLSGLDPGHVAGRIDELAEILEYGSYLDRPYGKLSGGQKRRVDIARALLHKPEILFLDEPTTGLDPGSRLAVWQAVHDLRAETGLTVFLTTHYMEETEQVDQICIIDDGRLVASGSPAELRATYSQSILTLTSAAPAALDEGLAAQDLSYAAKDNVFTITVPSAQVAQQILINHGADVRDFEFRHGRMDDVFLNVTGQEAAA